MHFVRFIVRDSARLGTKASSRKRAQLPAAVDTGGARMSVVDVIRRLHAASKASRFAGQRAREAAEMSAYFAHMVPGMTGRKATGDKVLFVILGERTCMLALVGRAASMRARVAFARRAQQLTLAAFHAADQNAIP